MTEPVRLVIWDLDETFWQGTVTEGGHHYSREAHDIVIALARRGIISSICSKNDYDVVKRILEDAGIWAYFILPSINWEPKGPRIAALIEAVQLRPETVLFIDDNPSNLQQALHFTPALQTASETAIAGLLDNPLLQGKDDAGLTRLAHYKVLERRRAEQAAAVSASGGSNAAFLKASNIRVRIERDVERHIDRAIELINRTNQLNFTKSRLPEEAGQARTALRHLLDEHMVQAGLLDVSDNYGAYGYCGFYMTRAAPSGMRLLHFCFSCRILDMGVEAWAYQTLGRPFLRVRGKVLSNPIVAEPVDWITLDAGTTAPAGPDAAARSARSSVAARGGCVLTPLLHYFAATASRTVGEYNTVRGGNVIRLDHSLVFKHALDGLTADQLAAAASIGYCAADFQTAYFDHDGPRPIWVFSNWADLGCPLFRHKATGLRIPHKPPAPRPVMPESVRRVEAALAADFEPAGFLAEDEMKDILRAVFSRVPAHGSMFVLLSYDSFVKNGERRKIRKRLDQNRWTMEVAAEFTRVRALDMADFVEQDSDVKEGPGAGHFDRMVYFRIYEEIMRLMGTPAFDAVA